MNSVARRPAMIWAICGYCVLSAGLSIVSLVSGTVPLEVSQQAHFRRAAVLEYSSSIAIIALMLAGAILLFKLRKSAVVAFGILLAFTVLSDLARFLMSDTTELYGGVLLALAAPVFGWVLETSALLYALLLRKRGLLA